MVLKIGAALVKGTFYASLLLLAGCWALLCGMLAFVAALTIVGLPAAAGLIAIGGAPLAYLLRPKNTTAQQQAQHN